MNYKTLLIITAIAWTILSIGSFLVLYTNARTPRDKRTWRTTRKALTAAVLFFAFFLGGLELMRCISNRYTETEERIQEEAMRELRPEIDETPQESQDNTSNLQEKPGN